MSAWVCSDQHINYIVSAAVRFDGYNDLGMKPEDMGRLLLAENVRSVLHRYGDDTLGVDEVAEYAAQIDGYKYVEVVAAKQVDALKLLDSWAYQTCETEDYKTTKAWDLGEQIKHILIKALPGYADAPWSLD